MKCWIRKLLIFAIVMAFAALGIVARLGYRAAFAYQKLAATVSSVTSVTIYAGNYQATDLSTNALSSASSAQFPVDVFVTAAGSAEYRSFGLWKGSPLVVLTLRDGTRQRARISYYGGFFGLEGVPGIYIVPGGQNSEFFTTFRHVLEQLAPKDNGQKKSL